MSVVFCVLDHHFRFLFHDGSISEGMPDIVGSHPWDWCELASEKMESKFHMWTASLRKFHKWGQLWSNPYTDNRALFRCQSRLIQSATTLLSFRYWEFPGSFATLTQREHEVLIQHAVSDPIEIAEIQNCHLSTITTHLRNIRGKVNLCKNGLRTEAVRYADSFAAL